MDWTACTLCSKSEYERILKNKIRKKLIIYFITNSVSLYVACHTMLYTFACLGKAYNKTIDIIAGNAII
jgi:hypothetical protein